MPRLFITLGIQILECIEAKGRQKSMGHRGGAACTAYAPSSHHHHHHQAALIQTAEAHVTQQHADTLTSEFEPCERACWRDFIPEGDAAQAGSAQRSQTEWQEVQQPLNCEKLQKGMDLFGLHTVRQFFNKTDPKVTFLLCPEK
ncbi:hypothetical protein PO909_006984 [Leuciscus waleckii]